MCYEHKSTHINENDRKKKKKYQLGWHPAFHPSMLLIILKATRVCMGHRPCQNRLYIVYKVYGGCKLCEGKIKEEDLLIINFTEFMAFRENDFASLNEENVQVVSKLIFYFSDITLFHSLFELHNFVDTLVLSGFFS